MKKASLFIALIVSEITVGTIIQAVHPWIAPVPLAIVAVVDILLALGHFFEIFPFLRLNE